MQPPVPGLDDDARPDRDEALAHLLNADWELLSTVSISASSLLDTLSRLVTYGR